MKKPISILLLACILVGSGFSQSSVKVCKAPPNEAAVIFRSDFETDNADLSPTWVRSGGSSFNATLNTNPTYSHGGSNSGQFRYQISAGGSASLDTNVAASKLISPTMDHVFVRGYVYFKSPESDATNPPTSYAWRKMLWVSDSTSMGTDQVNYSSILTAWSAVGRSTLSLSFGGNNVTSCASGANTTIWDMVYINWDQWYSIELELQLNTPGNSDGIVRLYVDGVPSGKNSTSYNLRGTCTSNYGYMKIGVQTNRTNYDVVDEYRYWDDVKLSSAYIGP